MQQDERGLQALSYIRYQAAKPREELRALIERTAADCARHLEGVSEAQAVFKPAAEEWSIAEVLRHFTPSVERVSHFAQRLAAGKAVQWEPRVGTLGYEGISFVEIREKLGQAWQACLAVLASAPASTDEETRVAHPFFGPLNWREWIAFQRIHALDHLQQIEAIKSDPRYPRA